MVQFFLKHEPHCQSGGGAKHVSVGGLWEYLVTLKYI